MAEEQADRDRAKAIYAFLEAHIDELRQTGTLTCYPDDVSGAYDIERAFRNDHPELFWLKTLESDTDYEKNKIVFSCGTSYNYGDPGPGFGVGTRDLAVDEALVQKQVKAICDGARAAGDTRYEQLLYVHDWLVKHNHYGIEEARTKEEARQEHFWEMDQYYDTSFDTCLSALDESLFPICSGYSSGFKVLCDELGIPCYDVSGKVDEGHTWNYVQMENGKWYGVDATFDDPWVENGKNGLVSGAETHTYFLKGSDSFFTRGREEYPDWLFSYPTLAVEDFDPKAPVPEVEPRAPLDTSAFYVDLSEPRPESTPEPTPESAYTPGSAPVFRQPTPTPEPFWDTPAARSARLPVAVLILISLIVLIISRVTKKARRR